VLEELKRTAEGQVALRFVTGGAQHPHPFATGLLGGAGEHLRAARAGRSVEDHERAESGRGTIDGHLDQRDFRVAPEEGNIARRNA
jgi:hypothetical protein